SRQPRACRSGCAVGRVWVIIVVMCNCDNLQSDLLARRFRTLGHPDRLRILSLLLSHISGLCVCELADVLELPEYKVSRHLKSLAEAGWVRGEHDGPWVYYVPVSDPLLKTLEQHLACSTDDEKRLRRRMALRREGRCVVGPRGEPGWRSGSSFPGSRILFDE
ncbi:MAG: helix-turn-helix domain-containing protein, partial [Candidatus Bipolaricaulota bacterium]